MPVTAFLTDSTLCIGCKACEVACKEWNGIPGRRVRVHGVLVRQHREPRSLDVAARQVRRAGRGAGRGPPTAATAATPSAGTSRRTCASTAKMPAASKRVQPARSYGPSLAASSSSPTSATAAATASSRARSASSIGGRMTDARSSAPSATTARTPDCSRRARRRARPSRFSSARSTTCASALPVASRCCASAALTMPGCTTRRTASVGGTHAIFIFRGEPEE